MEEENNRNDIQNDNESTCSRKKGFCKYKSGLYSTIPFRTTNLNSSELPIDKVGCISNATFSWVRKYRITSKNDQTHKKVLPQHIYDDEVEIGDEESNKLSLSKCAYADSCKVNSKRIIGLYKNELRNNTGKGFSMFKVAWKFCRTRIIIANLMHVLSIVFGLLGLALFLNKSLTAMNNERQLLITLRDMTNGSEISTDNSFLQIQLITFNFITKTSSNQSTDNFEKLNINGTNDVDDESDERSYKSSLNLAMSKVNQIEKHIKIEANNKIFYAYGIPICFLVMLCFRSATNWINLRTATRLRTACISSAFSKAIKSSVIYNIHSHQIISLACEESELIYSFILKGSQIIGSAIGVCLYTITSVYLLGIAILWSQFTIIFLCIAGIRLAIMSTHYFRESLLHSGKKLTVIEKLCLSFKNTNFLHVHDNFVKLFSNSLMSQYLALLRSELYSTKFSGGITSAIILGGLFIVWCDEEIEYDNIMTLILIIMYAHFLQIIVMDICDSLGYILQGRAILNKLKNIYELSSPTFTRRTNTKNDLKLSISKGNFKWETPANIEFSNNKYEDFEIITGDNSEETFTLYVHELLIPKQQIIGITGVLGSGKTSLLYAIMGYMKLIEGEMCLNGVFRYFPEIPYTKIGTIKENIIFGEQSYDHQKYLNVLEQTNLTSLLLEPIGTDDLPIGYLQLGLGQLQKIDLAQALYCNRDIIIFDEPLSALDDQEASELFERVSLELLNTNKTIIVATQSDYILRHCHQIYVIDKGSVLSSRSYEDIKQLEAYNKMINYYNLLQATLRDYNPNEQTIHDVIAPENPSVAKSFNRSISTRSDVSNEGNSANVITKENAAHNHIHFVTEDKAKLYYFSKWTIAKISILHFVCAIAYISIPFGFIIVMDIDYVEPYLSLFALGAIFGSFLIDIIIKMITFKEASRLTQKYQQIMFSKLISTTLNFINENVVGDIVNYFQDDTFKNSQIYSSRLKFIITIIVLIGFQIYGSIWNIIVMVLIVGSAKVLYHYYRHTVKYLCKLEYESRRSMILCISNMLKGRVALQSYEEHYRAEFYELVEKNSTAILLRKSIVFYAQFLLGIIQVMGFYMVICILLLLPFTRISEYNYLFGIFLYFVLVHNVNLFLEGQFDMDIGKEKIELINKFCNIIPILKCGIELSDKEENLALDIDFNSVSVRIQNKLHLNINKLNIRKSETIGIRGKGSNLIAPLLSRILIPTVGTIFIGDRDIRSLSKKYLERNIGIVPQHPYIYSGTIRYIIDPENTFKEREIKNILERFNLWTTITKLPQTIDEPIKKLSRKNRQLLCLARCWRILPSIIIVERPHPHIQKFVDEVIHSYFIESTVIVIGSHHTQLSECQRVIELN